MTDKFKQLKKKMQILVSPHTGRKYISVDSAVMLQKRIEKMLKREGISIKTHFHPTYIEVPTSGD